MPYKASIVSSLLSKEQEYISKWLTFAYRISLGLVFIFDQLSIKQNRKNRPLIAATTASENPFRHTFCDNDSIFAMQNL